MTFARIAGTGSYLPDNIVTNKDLEQRVDTSDQWIRERTGIEQRHIALPGQTTVDLAEQAALRAIEAAGIDAKDIDLIVFATTTPDKVFPSCACILQARLGIEGCPAFDIQAVCSGFVYALATAEKFIRTGSSKKALVIGAEVFSRILNWDDRGTCVLFGDGAGAVVLEIDEKDSDFGIRSSVLHADGAYRDILYVDGGPSSNQDVGYVRMEGKEVFRHAIEKLAAVMDEALTAADMQPQDIDWLVPHQANIRIIDGMQKKMQLPNEKVVRTVDQHANTSAASIPLALATAVDDGRVKNGDVLAMEAIGGGLVWGAALVKYGRPA